VTDGAYARHDGPLDRARAFLERLLRVPPPPEAPAGSPGSVRRFRAAPGFYRYRLLQWGLKQLGALWGLTVGLTFVSRVPDFPYDWILHAIELVGGKEHQHRDLHLGFFRGVDDAEAIRDLILAHLRHLRDSGLGDPDEELEAAGVEESGGAPRAQESGAVAAARELLAAARELRSL
jgi:hypothetical protein